MIFECKKISINGIFIKNIFTILNYISFITKEIFGGVLWVQI